MTETNSSAANQSSSTALNQLLNKFTQGIKEESKIQRKNALEFMLKQLKNSFNQKSGREEIKFTLDSLKVILKLSLSLCNDQAEKCRELANEQIKLILENSKNNTNEWDNDMSTMVLMTFYQRLGGKEIKEPSEEIRLESMNILYDLIDIKLNDAKHVFEVHLQEIVAILINSFNDNYSEVKKKGCLCAKLVANRLASSNFHMQSESLIKPLLANLTHQHSRVRKDIIDCLCDVVMYGNNKSVTDVVSHLAQRLFDQVATVRMAVIKLVGTWLLDLPDRYSFHHRLMPLLLTGFVDESLEIKELTESLWWDVGIKYEKENDEDLKEKSSFLETEHANYPSEFKEKRPNLGCRELIRLNASKIIPGILNDVGDWVEATRIKSIQLLYIIIWQCETNITQHLETVLQSLFRASSESIDQIQTYVFQSAKLIGNFTDSKITLKIALKTIKKMNPPNPGALKILNGLLIGHNVKKVSFQIVIDIFDLLNEVSTTLDVSLHKQVAESLLILEPLNDSQILDDAKSKSQLEYALLLIAYKIISLSKDEESARKAQSILAKINSDLIKEKYLLMSINEFKLNCEAWTDNSLEPIVFVKLLSDYGLLPNIIQEVNYILKKSLHPDRDVQLRTKFLLLIPEIFTSSKQTANESTQLEFLQNCFEDIMNEMIFPNIAWKAGRAASAIRMTAIASLALLMQAELSTKIEVKQATLEKMLSMMSSNLDDDNKQTRLYVGKTLLVLLCLHGGKFSKDQLHKLYPELIKRLDDQNDEIRFEIIKIFRVYFDVLSHGDKYDSQLYQAHLQMIYENLLLYLDDSNIDFRDKIFNLLKHSSKLGPEYLLKELEKSKSKYLNHQKVEELIKQCKNSF